MTNTLKPDLTVNDFCKLIRVSRQTAYHLMNTGQIAYYNVTPRARRIRWEAAEALRDGRIAMKPGRTKYAEMDGVNV